MWTAHLEPGTMIESHRNRRVSSSVVGALAAATGDDPLALDPPLYRVVDGEALDRLFEGPGRIRVEFEYEGRAVVVRGDGVVAVDGTVYGEGTGE